MSHEEKSWIVYGPQGCGKSRHASAIAKALGVTLIVDGWDGGQATFHPVNALHLALELPGWAAESRRAISFADAMARVRDVIRYLGDVQRLQLGPDDILVVTNPGRLPMEVSEYIRANLNRLMPGRLVLVLDGGMSIGVLAQQH